VSAPWAYFTTQPLEKQWGDDWNDAPYEHNAGTPYGPYKEGESWEIIRVAFDGPFEAPCDGVSNSAYSVEAINRGAVAWLYDRYGDSGIAIPAGTTLTVFKDLVRKARGQVFVEEKS